MTRYCPQYPKVCTNHSAKPVCSNIVGCLLLLLCPYILLQTGKTLPYAEIYFNAMPSACVDKYYRALVCGSPHGFFKAVGNVAENVVGYLIHSLLRSLENIPPLRSISILNHPFVLIPWILSMPKPIRFLHRAAGNLRNKRECIKFLWKCICISSCF